MGFRAEWMIFLTSLQHQDFWSWTEELRENRWDIYGKIIIYAAIIHDQRDSLGECVLGVFILFQSSLSSADRYIVQLI
jgi:hypothetical protein